MRINRKEKEMEKITILVGLNTSGILIYKDVNGLSIINTGIIANVTIGPDVQISFSIIHQTCYLCIVMSSWTKNWLLSILQQNKGQRFLLDYYTIQHSFWLL